jgi:anti-anti-sigma regulatory factor
MSLDLNGLEYFLSEKTPFLVVSFVGVMSKSESDVIEQCQVEIEKRGGKLVAISLHDVKKIDAIAYPPLVKLQKSIRDRGGFVRVCFVRPELRRVLAERAVIRDHEISPNLLEALEALQADLESYR